MYFCFRNVVLMIRRQWKNVNEPLRKLKLSLAEFSLFKALAIWHYSELKRGILLMFRQTSSRQISGSRHRLVSAAYVWPENILIFQITTNSKTRVVKSRLANAMTFSEHFSSYAKMKDMMIRFSEYLKSFWP